ncbi:hypothetical protein D9C01_13380, partial [Corynebacterium diphtheriae]
AWTNLKHGAATMDTLISMGTSVALLWSLYALFPRHCRHSQFTYWQWASLALAAPVIIWGAWPFHKAAWTNLKHGAATMDTLISMGTSVALLWSLYALF